MCSAIRFARGVDFDTAARKIADDVCDYDGESTEALKIASKASTNSDDRCRAGYGRRPAAAKHH